MPPAVPADHPAAQRSAPPGKVLLIGAPGAQLSALQRRFGADAQLTRVMHCFLEELAPMTSLLMLEEQLDVFRPERVVICPGPLAPDHRGRLHPAQMLQAHLLVPAQAIDLAMRAGVRSLLFVASMDVYPGGATGPNAEEDLMTARPACDSLELATAHMACLRLCEAYSDRYGPGRGMDYRSLVVGDTFGPGDAFDPACLRSIPSLIARIHNAHALGECWVELPACGRQRRDWLYGDDFASACCHVLSMSGASYQRHTRQGWRHLNAGSGRPMTLGELAGTIARVIGYTGDIRPGADDGKAPVHRHLDTHRLRRTGWRPWTPLEDAIRKTWQAFQQTLPRTPGHTGRPTPCRRQRPPARAA